MIVINKSSTADTRSCDWSSVSKDQLLESSIQHIDDVKKGIEFMCDTLLRSVHRHDHDKISDIDGFHRDFVTGFKEHQWFDNHIQVNRHHLGYPEAVPEDVDLLDIIEMVVDCTMAGMGRSDEIYPIEIPNEVLQRAVNNTMLRLKSEIIIKE
jgi:hypothetical protein